MGDYLGRSRNLGQGSATRPNDIVYGQTSIHVKKAMSGKPQWGTKELIKGEYSFDAQLPDKDLGKSITPGFRNSTLESRAFGVPSIRTDLPHNPSMVRSVADSQNYGDDVSAKDLVNPPAFSDMKIEASMLIQPRTRDYLFKLFNKIG